MSKKKKITAKKALLQETTMRRWGKLTQLNENSGFAKKLEEMYPGEEEDELGSDMPPPEMGDEMDVEEPAAVGGGDEALVQDIVAAVADAIESVTGVEVSVSGPAGGEELPGGEEEMPPMGDEIPGEEEPVEDEMLEVVDDMVVEGDDQLSDLALPKDLKEDTDQLSDLALPKDLKEGEEEVTTESEEKVEEAEKELNETKKKKQQLVNEVVKRVVARLRKVKPKKPTTAKK